MTPYAIVECGGQQYRAEKGQELVVDRMPDDEGGKVTLRPVMYRSDKDVVLDQGGLEKVKVEAVVAEHMRGPKVRVFKYKPKKGYRRRAGHRSELTRLEVTEVKMLQRKPAAQKTAEKPEAGKTATKRAAPKKQPAAKKAATSKKSTSARKSSSGKKAEK